MKPLPKEQAQIWHVSFPGSGAVSALNESAPNAEVWIRHLSYSSASTYGDRVSRVPVQVLAPACRCWSGRKFKWLVIFFLKQLNYQLRIRKIKS